MDKVLAFLEKYVEWIAIALGGLIFMYAVWIYWIAPDVTAEVAGQQQSPGNVDEAVLQGPGQSLRDAMDYPRLPPRPDVGDLPGEFLAQLRLDAYEPQPLQVAGMRAGPSPISAPTGFLPDDFKVKETPTPPPAEVVRLASGRSLADVPEGPQAQQVAAIDLAEVRVDFTIPKAEIAEAFRTVSLPTAQQNTSMLRVKLMRQRQLPDGSWGEESEVPLLSNNPLGSQFPLPPESAGMEVKQEYAQFAEQNVHWVLQPPFYTVTAGDDPMALKVVVQPPQPGEGAQPAGGDPDGDTGDGNTGDGDTGEGDAVPADGEGRSDFRSQDAARRPQPAADQPQARQRPGQGNDEQPAAPALPPGVFNVPALPGPLNGWAWDTDAVPGETYRYQVVYWLKNPLFGTSGVAADPELESRLAIQSEPSEWSLPITVEPLIYFYMTAGSNAQATFTVFRWQNGGWQAEEFKVTPGDPVGMPSDEGVDFRTGRTLVDVRTDPSDKQVYALLVDDQGRFVRRTAKDAADPRLKQLQQQAAARGDPGVAQR